MELMFLFVRLLMVVRTVDADVVRRDVTGLDATLDVDEVSDNKEAAVRCCCPLFNGKLSWRMLAAGDVESPGSLPVSSMKSIICLDCQKHNFWHIFLLIWAATCQNQQNGCSPSLIRVFAVCMKKAWVLRYPLSAQRRLLIRLGGCPGWSESSLGAHSFCWFCHVVAHFYNSCSRKKYLFLLYL